MNRFWGQIRITPIFIALLAVMFTASVLADIPRPEHPRPDHWRDNWINLNGQWNFKFDPDNAGNSQEWFKADYADWPKQKINVPFAWESRLSGIEKPDYKGVAWYQRTIERPAGWEGQNILLHFSAVDWSIDVWLNGQPIKPEAGGMSDYPPHGYVPVVFNITDALQNGANVLTVRVEDTTSPTQPVGKQVNWYTRTSGIWQTVYMEATRKNGLKYIAPFPSNDGSVEMRVVAFQPADNLSVRVLPDVPYDAAGPSKTVPANLEPNVEIKNDHINVKFKLDDVAIWSPESPTLYFVKVQLLDGGEVVDTVHTYFGFREVARKPIGDNPYETTHLNGKPFYILSALNQAFHPEGVYTYPTDALIRQDVEDAKEFGFNNLRLHIKVDEPRFYYWCDRLGMTLMYDFPCPWQFDADMRDNFKKVFFEALLRDFNHPSIITWVIFNETWGIPGVKDTPEVQDFVKEMVGLTKRIDPTRLVEDNSPCNYDHVVTDVNSWHFYIYEHNNARKHIENVVVQTFPGSNFNYADGFKQETQPLINSEYGGVSAGMGDRDIAWCFHYLTQELRRHDKIGGYVYTELQDIEWEHNGFMNYDRSRKIFGYEEYVPTPKDHPPFTYRDLNQQDFLVLDAMNNETATPFETKHIKTALSLYSGHKGGKFALRWRLWKQDRLDLDWQSDQAGRGWINAKAYAVAEGDDVTFIPEPDALYCVYAWVEDNDGELIARNFWTVNTLSGDYSGEERHVQMMAGGDRKYIEAPEWYVRWNPTDYTEATGEIEQIPKENRDSVSIPGKAQLTYQVSLPSGVDLSKVKKVKLQLELAACSGGLRLDPLERAGWFEKPEWRKKNNLAHFPQTDVGNEYPSTVEVLVNGQIVQEITLPNDPADYRGVLSNIFEQAPPSVYGYLQRIYVPVSAINADRSNEIVIRTKEGSDTGVRVFGAYSGRHPFPPSMILYESGQ